MGGAMVGGWYGSLVGTMVGSWYGSVVGAVVGGWYGPVSGTVVGGWQSPVGGTMVGGGGVVGPYAAVGGSLASVAVLGLRVVPSGKTGGSVWIW